MSVKRSSGDILFHWTVLLQHQINWWWETQVWKLGKLMVFIPQMEKSKTPALFSFMSSWPLKSLNILSVIPFKVSLLSPCGYWRTTLSCAAKWGRSNLFWFLPIIPGQFSFQQAKWLHCGRSLWQNNFQISFSNWTSSVTSVEFVQGPEGVRTVKDWG